MAERGQDYTLELSVDGVVAYAPVGLLTSISVTREKNTIEGNNFDTPGWTESTAGRKSWSISAGALHVFSDAGQALVKTAYASDDPYFWKLRKADDETGSEILIGEGHLTSLEQEYEDDERVTFSIDIEGTGALAQTAA